jgi:divalent metal cation (Fe/Co/Zn/Cd) transporter
LSWRRSASAGRPGLACSTRSLLRQPGLGLAISVAAAILNFVVARILLTAGRRYQSITLEADAHHLMTDVWISAGVLIGVGAVVLTGWQ